MNAEKIKQLILEAELCSPSEANKISNLLHNHLVIENCFCENPEEYTRKAGEVSTDVFNEVLRAKKMFPKNFTNQHEGYAVILEEMDELWAEIKKNQIQYDIEAQRKEAIQTAAMLVRFIVELT
ncbi:MAG: hypothetical protein Q8O62_09985 [Aequorivita sp.]|nr:hypothetical protein [Aequorivita sp.]